MGLSSYFEKISRAAFLSTTHVCNNTVLYIFLNIYIYLYIYLDSRWSYPLKTLESPLDYKEIQPVHSKGDQPWDFFGRNDAKAETPVLWPPHAKS